VFGELALRFLDRTELLLWPDIEWEVCRASLEGRHEKQFGHARTEKLDESFNRLIAYAGAYWTRDDLRSHAGHLRLFEAFPGSKLRFLRRADVDEFISSERGRKRADSQAGDAELPNQAAADGHDPRFRSGSHR
jgi:hypothetical protein